MKFETKNKPDLFCYNGTEYYSDGGASFEWLIDKLRDSGAFGLKKNADFNKTLSSYYNDSNLIIFMGAWIKYFSYCSIKLVSLIVLKYILGVGK